MPILSSSHYFGLTRNLLAAALAFYISLTSQNALAVDIEALRNSPQLQTLLHKSREAKSAKNPSQQKIRVIVRSALDLSQTEQSQRISKGLGKLKAFAARSGMNPENEINGLPLVVYEVNENQLNALVASGMVENIEEDRLLEPHLAQSMAMIKQSVAQNFGLQGSGAAVAILDTGVQSNHPMLTGRVTSEACFSTTSSANSATSLCPSGGTSIKKSGFTIGYKGTGQAVPCNGLAAGISGCDHGTHVASIAAGAPAGGAGSGVAPQANVIAIQVFSYVNSEAICGVGKSPCLLNFTSDLYNALYYVQTIASANNIAAANLSLGGGQFTSICDADSASGSNTVKTYIDNLRNSGVVTVASSGNNGYTSGLTTPACISTSFSVGSVSDTSDVVSSWSNSASFLDMLAPGSPIYAATTGSGYTTKSATSMAAPHVSGAAALLKGFNSSYTAAQIESLIVQNGVAVTDSRNGITKPRLDLAKMTQSAAGSGYSPTVTINQPANNAVIDRSGIVLSATANDPQDGNISANVTWTSSVNGTITSPATLTAGSHTLTATIADSIGFTSSSSVNITAGNAPTITITAPAGNLAILQGQAITLSGTATDVENGNLSNSIQWASSLGGTLGSGASINILLGLGAHVITASVTDSAGLTPKVPATRTITVTCTDCDGDGMADSWEAQYNLGDPNGDEDSDGINNLNEFINGSHPRDAAPIATISTPANNSTYGCNVLVPFSAMAIDNEDGDISSGINWQSDKDGNLGRGAILNTHLSHGQHLISIDVVDSRGAHPSSSANIIINMGIKGDINGDGKVNAIDLLLLKRNLIGEKIFTESEMSSADLYPESGDGKIDISDLYQLEKMIITEPSI